ncbi:arginine--tRNA ligase [Rickettsiales endosymbiont of Peranema trichophorum]|uniref:arginine--tRNA ligase n=1 Tax=Rickettsiales endosymbiont of Peranema trichophorum TaxID=2486577 RepID=UPI0010233501|nr:arginine--tRNA ligase [Rickettsiales endosymbiont of Peranema trichophorum]RZI46321.1 arginine--tRNA ligase [Rickettsiales endosymbiont of Peranema trichophorum]
MDILKSLSEKIVQTVRRTLNTDAEFPVNVVEFPKNQSYGELSTNIAMLCAKTKNEAAIDIAKTLANEISKFDEVQNVTVVAPGFINMVFVPSFWQGLVSNVVKMGDGYGRSSIGSGSTVNIEFVSVNPTGPMHVGHSRGAIYGDALSRLLQFIGFKVVKEYYINDAGNQVKLLTESLWVRYLQALGDNVDLKDEHYPGQYLVDVAKELLGQYGPALKEMEEWERFKIVRRFAIDSMMALIKRDIAALGVTYDLFTSEQDDILDSGMEREAFALLQEKGLIYRGILGAPKGKLPEEWEPREQDLFRSTSFGDDVDRPLKRSDGTFTYFAGDIAYHLHKLKRKYDRLIVILGADHFGYVKRLKSAVNALSGGAIELEVKLYQYVNLLKSGEPFKMSKRAGIFIGVADVLAEVDKDILRFVMLSRKSDTMLDFDFVKVQEQTKDNPVFYVQYAHTRACSILRKANVDFEVFKSELLKEEMEIGVIKHLALFPRVIESAALLYEPHRLIFYLEELAHKFHMLWNSGIESERLRFIIDSDQQLTKARLGLVKALQSVLSSGLSLLGIKALDRM